MKSKSPAAKTAKKQTIRSTPNRRSRQDDRPISLGTLTAMMDALRGPDELTLAQRRRFVGQLLPLATYYAAEDERARQRRPEIPALNLAALKVHVLRSEHGASVKNAAGVVALADQGQPAMKLGSIQTRYRALKRAGDFPAMLAVWQKVPAWDQAIADLAKHLSPMRRSGKRKK